MYSHNFIATQQEYRTKTCDPPIRAKVATAASIQYSVTMVPPAAATLPPLPGLTRVPALHWIIPRRRLCCQPRLRTEIRLIGPRPGGSLSRRLWPVKSGGDDRATLPRRTRSHAHPTRRSASPEGGRRNGDRDVQPARSKKIDRP